MTHPSRCFRCLTTITMLACAASALAQSHLYVDPVLGNDFATGSNASAPVRTLGRAMLLAQQAVAPRTVHLAAGAYGVASGETWPVQLTRETTLIGDAGAGVTSLIGSTPADTLVHTAGSITVQDVTFRGGASALRSYQAAGILTLRGVSIEDSTEWGILSMGVAPVLVEGCTIVGTGRSGFAKMIDTFELASSVTLRDSHIEDCGEYGVLILSQYHATFFVSLERVTVDRCGLSALLATDAWHSGWVTTHLTASDCQFTRSGVGVDLAASSGSLVMRGCTVAGNAARGLLDRWSLPSSIDGCILARNGGPDATGVQPVVRSLVEDGSAGLGLGSLTGDPRFVDPAAGDFRLRFDSPCVDAAGSGASSVDVDGRPRRMDGNLDLAGASDMGAHELQTLSGPASVALSGTFEFELHGPAGGFTTLVESRSGFAPFGIVTPFGRFFLPLAIAQRVAVVPTTGGVATRVVLAAPNSPATHGYQALTRSAAAALGGAWTNPVSVSFD